MENLARTDPEVADAVRSETRRQGSQLELIASENFVSEAVLEALGTVLTNKYAEGYPGKRYYGGCEFVDVVENLAIERPKQLFGCDHANVQPHSGRPGQHRRLHGRAQAGRHHPGHEPLARRPPHARASAELLRPDSTRSWPTACARRTSGSTTRPWPRWRDEHKPKVIVVGASAYPRTIDFAAVRRAADECGAVVMADIAHIAGLVAAGLHPSPVPHAEFVTTTTHKTLRGPRGGMVMCQAKWQKELDKLVFPGIQGGPLMHVIAAKAVAFKEALEPEFKAYQQQIVANARALAATLIGEGWRLVSGGTDNHLMLIDVFARGHHGQGGGGGPRPRRHHRQQEHHPLRHQLADGRLRHPHRHARPHHARDEGARTWSRWAGSSPARCPPSTTSPRLAEVKTRRAEAVRPLPALRLAPGGLRPRPGRARLSAYR